MIHLLLILTSIHTFIQSANPHDPTQKLLDAYAAALMESALDPAMRDLVETPGFDVNAANHLGNTPLLSAAQYGREDVCRLLIEHGANVNAANNYGYTPIHWAVRHGREALCRTPIHWAAQYGREDVCRQLIEHGANVNAANNYGYTPIHYAACDGSEALCRLLIYAGGRLELIGQQTKRERVILSCSPIAQLVLREDQAALENIMAPVPLPGRFRKLFMWAQRLLGWKTPEQKRQGQLNALLWYAAGQAKTDLCRQLLAAGATPWARCPRKLLPENYPQTTLELNILLLQHKQELVARYQQSPDLQKHAQESKQAIQNYTAIRDMLAQKGNARYEQLARGFLEPEYCKNRPVLPTDMVEIILQNVLRLELSPLIHQSSLQDVAQKIVKRADESRHEKLQGRINA